VLRAVLDANVYVSAIVRPEGPPGRIVGPFLRNAAFDLVVSPSIREEVLRSLARRSVRIYIRPGVDAALWFEDVVLLARLVSDDRHVSGVSRDPDDDIYFAAALEGRCAFVVSGDRDLLTVGEYEGVRVVTPRAFLTLLDT
jgi:uncharacterized protein